ncbi:DNA repair protein RecN [Gilvimarinus sp. F26214L]|uniref:DNA repair protein RecN n=1 Tax=Gilvimarinus sp. DZF01 TaxID=3461371 RepID=UPI004045F206
MLTHLAIYNYTLVDRLDLELHQGMTAITGETGAGKSVLLDALALTLGDRADADRIRAGQKRAEVNASFDIERLPAARQWLGDHDLDLDGECLLRRVITAEGRSRAYINGQPVTIAQLRSLGQMLIDIHAQHEHQSLLKKDTQRRLLDEYAGHQELAAQVATAYREWQATLTRFRDLKENAEEASARIQLLSYQVEELDQLALQPDEVQQLEAEQKTLANGEAILHNSYKLVALCGGEDQSLLEAMNQALQIVEDLPQDVPAFREAAQMLASAQIQVEEAQSGVERYIDGFELDPERLQFVEERLSAIFEIARKHRVQPDELPALHQNLSTELQGLAGEDGDLDRLAAKLEQLETEYRRLAETLSAQRQSAGKRLAKAVNQQLKKLSMEHARLEVDLTPGEKPAATGLEEVQLVISTNPGQPLKPLVKIASGGELSRISLAIQVVTAQTSPAPTLVFDEIDVGIGGATADTVGRLLRQLGERAQIICVTHLAQVASKAHSHLRVNKSTKGNTAMTSLEQLNHDQRVEEIARMIGNNRMTQASLDHAREMVEA